ncbi:MAG: SDR family oxidoreductase [Pirellula sp.]
MRVLITGARGFVGRAIADEAVARNWTVMGVGRSSQAPDGWPGSYAWADIAQSDLRHIVDSFKPDIVFHGAGAASVGNSFEFPTDDLRASTMTFASLLDSVRRSSVRPVIVFPSSAAVYGNPERLPICETDRTRPISPYGFHKLQCELLADEYTKCFGLQVIICRIFSVFGARQKRLLIWDLFQQMISNEEQIHVQGTGEESRDFLPVEDAAHCILDLATANDLPALSCFNIASGFASNVNQIVDRLMGILDCKKSVVWSRTSRLGDPLRWQADVRKLAQFTQVPSSTQVYDRLFLTAQQWLAAKK